MRRAGWEPPPKMEEHLEKHLVRASGEVTHRVPVERIVASSLGGILEMVGRSGYQPYP